MGIGHIRRIATLIIAVWVEICVICRDYLC